MKIFGQCVNFTSGASLPLLAQFGDKKQFKPDMMHHKRHKLLPQALLPAFFLFLLSCQQQSEASFSRSAPPAPPQSAPEQSEAAPADDAAPFGASSQDNPADLFTSNAARPGAIDSLKKFIRSADLYFRVKNTAAATLEIEDIATRHGGFVTSSQLATNIDLQHITPVGRDSAIETTRYTVQTRIVLRVPNRQLDTVLRAIGRLSEFYHHRNISAEDVSLQMLEKELKQLREGIYRAALEVSPENETLPKADRARESRAAGDQARLEKMRIEDEIRYSTVQISVYQAPKIRQTTIANTDIPLPRKPFAARCADALHAGSEIITFCFLGILHLWGVFLLFAAIYAGWKRWNKHYQKGRTVAQKSA